MNSNLVTIAKFWYPAEAHVMRSFLEAHDILCFIFDENISRLGWYLAGDVGNIRLVVHKDDYEEAKRLLDENPEIREGLDSE